MVSVQDRFEKLIANKNTAYVIAAPGGASGHFLTHFLAPSFTQDTVSSAWIDREYEVEFNDRGIFTHDLNISTQDTFVVEAVVTNIDEYIKVAYNKWLKRPREKWIDAKLDIIAIDNAITTIFGWAYDDQRNDETVDHLLTVRPNDYRIKYDDVLNMDALTVLYEIINSTKLPLFKKQYALSYIAAHKEIFGSWIFKTVSRIFRFEYSNNVYIDYARHWDISDITEKNHISFLDSALQLTNYTNTKTC